MEGRYILLMFRILIKSSYELEAFLSIFKIKVGIQLLKIGRTQYERVRKQGANHMKGCGPKGCAAPTSGTKKDALSLNMPLHIIQIIYLHKYTKINIPQYFLELLGQIFTMQIRWLVYNTSGRQFSGSGIRCFDFNAETKSL